MIRTIIHIDGEKCDGCGACVNACHEGAIAIIDGKAKLLRDDYCDGMGDCLPKCPSEAISFEQREANPYDEEAVLENKQKKAAPFVSEGSDISFSGPGMQKEKIITVKQPGSFFAEDSSQLQNWPVQIRLASVDGTCFDGARLLISADCAAYSYADFHREFMRGRVTLIGCPKLDAVDYSEKLTAIIEQNDIQSVTLVRMKVGCCGGLEKAAKKALMTSGKSIPWQVVVISTDGKIIG